MKIEMQEPAYRAWQRAGDALEYVANTGSDFEDDPGTRGLSLTLAGSDLIVIVLTTVSIGASTPDLDYNT